MRNDTREGDKSPLVSEVEQLVEATERQNELLEAIAEELGADVGGVAWDTPDEAPFDVPSVGDEVEFTRASGHPRYARGIVRHISSDAVVVVVEHDDGTRSQVRTHRVEVVE